MFRPSHRLLAAVSLIALCLVGGLVAAAPGEDDLARARRFLQEKSYGKALTAFESALADPKHAGEADAIRLDIGACLSGLQKWPQAEAHLRALAKDRADTLTEARARARLGELLRAKPHHVWIKDGKPVGTKRVQGATYRDTTKDDLAAGDEAFTRAHALFTRAIGDDASAAATRGAVARERAEVNLLHARLIEQWIGARAGWWWRGRGIEDGRKRQAIARELFGRILALLEENYLTAVLHEDAVGAARALYHRGMARRRASVQWWLRDLESNEPIPEAETAASVFERLLREFPKDRFADDARYSLGLLAEQRSDFVAAIAHYRALRSETPESRWSADAAHRIRTIERPTLSLDTGGIRLPGERPTIALASRNIAKVTFRAYRVPLDRHLGDEASLMLIGGGGLEQLASSLSTIARDAMRENLEAEWSKTTPDEGKHKPRTFESTVPVSGSGAFLIEASGDGVRVASVLVISDLAVVRKKSSDRSIFFVANARTGAPEAGVSIAVRHSLRGKDTEVTLGVTDADGVFVCPATFGVGQRYGYSDAFAWTDGRYAFTGWRYQYRYRERLAGKVFAFTDRGVYRPGQKVAFSALMRAQPEAGDYRSIADRAVAIEIRGPRGKKMLERTLRTDAYGMLDGEWRIPMGAPLGAYRLLVNQGRGRRGPSRSIAFRVEEYKRPEFEVTVAATGTPRIGEPVTAAIDARYYFGGAVAGARVKYTVTRRAYHHRVSFRDPFAFLYDRAASFSYRATPSGRTDDELVGQGEVRTDAEGRAEIRFDTAGFGAKYPGQDHRFRIRAEVMDLSRRTIEGEGTVTLTKTAFFAAVRPDRGFAAPGESVRIELRTERADHRALAVTGLLRVVALAEDARPGPVKRGGAADAAATEERVVYTAPIETDANGRATIEWKATDQGRYELRFEARDETEAVVVGAAPFWVCGADWRGGRYRYDRLEVLTDRATYSRGDVARILINATVDDPTLLVCEEAGRRIMRHRVVRVQGRSTVLEIPVTEAWMPNAFLDVLMVRDAAVHRAYRELFVPPVERFLNVDIAYATSRYEPGDEASAVVRVTDHRGEPIRDGRVALGTVDASLDYIQGDPTPDIRRFFYGDRRTRQVSLESSFSYRARSLVLDSVTLPKHRYRGNPPGWNRFPGSSDLAWGADQQAPGMLDHGGDRRRDRSSDDAPSEEAEPESKLGAVAEAPAASAMAPADGAAPKKRLARRAARPAAPTEVRENFAETAHFAPAVPIGADGTATIGFRLPDSVTRWRTTARAYTADTRVGQRRATFVTVKRLLVRPQVPRFFRERDEVVVSAIVNSALDATAEVSVSLAVSGGSLRPVGEGALERRVTVAAGGETRVDWRFAVASPGAATLEFRATSPDASDAVRQSFPVLPYGSRRTVSHAVALRGDASRATFTFDVPAARAPGRSALVIDANPTLAGVVLDALPYLLQYPYGCVEQTMSRLLPAALTRATLRRAGIDLEQLATRRRLVRPKSQAHGRDPVFDSDAMHAMIAKGLRRIYGHQGSDGGFGWFPGGRSDPYMTAYVLYGLHRAAEAEIDVDRRVVERALGFLTRVTAEERSLHRAAYQCYALALHGRTPPAEVFARVYDRREHLNHYTRAVLALAAHAAKRSEWARILVDNLEDFIETDARTGAASLPSAGYRWCWWSDSVETNAFALMALDTIRPTSPHRDGLMRGLVASRKGQRWRSTKDTAHAIYALTGYMERAGELDAEYTAEVLLDGEPIRTLKIDRSNVLTIDSRIAIDDARLATGEHVVEIVKRGRGSLYATASLGYFSLEDRIAAAGHELDVRRRYFRVTPVVDDTGGAAKQTWRREPLGIDAAIAAGDTIEVELEVDAHHDYEYVMIEDPKPSGFEPVARTSGSRDHGGIWTYMQLRDARVVFFMPRTPKGKVTLTYRMRAEAPGRLGSMPAAGELMYAPEIQGTSDNWRVVVRDE